MSEDLKKIAHELRAYSPEADQGKGKYVHEYWAKRLEALITPSLHPLQQCLQDNGELIGLKATVAQQAQMIEHLRGGPTPGFTAVDMGTAAADGFKGGRKSVGMVLGKGFNTLEQSGGKYSIVLAFQNSDDAYAAYTEIATVVRLGVEP